jgi:hypothetical protein
VLRGAINTVGASKSIITGLILCCIFVDPVVATFTWLYCQKTIVKKEVNRQIIGGLDKDVYTSITIQPPTPPPQSG